MPLRGRGEKSIIAEKTATLVEIQIRTYSCNKGTQGGGEAIVMQFQQAYMEVRNDKHNDKGQT